MKKNILSTICIVLITTLCVNKVYSESKAVWDLLWYFNVSEIQGDAGNYYPFMWEDNLYIAKWDGRVYGFGKIQKYERNGSNWTYTEDIQITGLPSSEILNLEGFCTDGQYIYSCFGTDDIFRINPSTWEVSGTITVSGETIDCIAYDEDQDGFWIATFNYNYAKFLTRTGTISKTLTSSVRISDLAWEKYSDGVPYLWMLSSDNAYLHRWNLTNDEFSQYAKSLSDVPGISSTSGAGLFTGIDPVLNKNVMIGLVEQSGNIVFCYDLGDKSNEFSDGDGSETNPYLITTTEQLEKLAKYVNEGHTIYNNKHYKLDNDIDISDFLGYDGPTIADAGGNQNECDNGSGHYVFTMNANDNYSIDERGKWAIVTSPAPNGVIILDDSDPFTQVSVPVGVMVELSWTISSENCDPSTDTVVLTAYEIPDITLEDSYTVCLGQNLTVQAVTMGGLPPYIYFWYGTTIIGTPDGNQFHVDTTLPQNGQVRVQASDDHGCYSAPKNALVKVQECDKSGISNNIEIISNNNPIETIESEQYEVFQNQNTIQIPTINNDKNPNQVQKGKCRGWIPIGTSSQPFKGVFDGDGHIISGLYILNSGFENAGLFGYVDGGTIKNLAVEDIEIKAKNSVGGIVGHLFNSSLSNCYSTGKITGNNRVGGLVGWHNYSNISNCYTECNVTGNEMVGSIAGWLDFSTLTSCYCTGEISGSRYVGGISGGINNDSHISDCVSLSQSIKGTVSNAGRIVGTYQMTLTNNAAFTGIINNAGNTTWEYIGEDLPDGADITVTEIAMDGALGNRFTSHAWTTQNGKLPGLFGKPAEIPKHFIPIILTESLPEGLTGYGYNQTLSVTFSPVTWSLVSGNIPTGLTLYSDGIIMGIPSERGDFIFTIKADNGLAFDTKEYFVFINTQGYPKILTTSLPNGEIDITYNVTLEAESETEVSWLLESGSLPPGLGFSVNGMILGRPTQNGFFDFFVRATNSIGYNTKGLSITIGNVDIEQLQITNYELRVYPNPTKGEFKVSGLKFKDGTLNRTLSRTLSEVEMEVEIYDVYGRLVLISPFGGGRGEECWCEVDISHFPAGIYFLRIGNQTFKIIKK